MASLWKIAAFCPNVLATSQAGKSLLMERKRTEASERGWERVCGGGKKEESREGRERAGLGKADELQPET